jgi:hypothetical protein
MEALHDICQTFGYHRLTQVLPFLVHNTPDIDCREFPLHGLESKGSNDQIQLKRTNRRQTFSAFTDLPEAIASHSPALVEYPVGIVIPGICGDHARLVT